MPRIFRKPNNSSVRNNHEQTQIIMNRQKFNELLRASFKSDDTEEWLDIHFNRPIGLVLALACKAMHIHPNTITIISIFLGAAAGWMFYYTDWQHNVLGIVFLMLANFCDSADGQLARITGQKTLLGRVLDGFSGDVWFFSIYLAIVLRLYHQPVPFLGGQEWSFSIFLLCLVAGVFFHSPQSSLSDYYRQIHLYFLLGKSGSELDDAETQRQKLKTFGWRDWFSWLYFFFYGNYCASQEKRTPQFQKFYRHVRSHSDMPRQLREDFRRESLPLMKYTNMLTFNVRAITIYLSCLLQVPYLFPLAEVLILSGMYVYMHRRHEHFCARLDERYFGQEA